MTIPEATAAELVAEVGGSLDRLSFLGRPSGPFVRGWSHLLAAPPKAGKSTLLYGLTREWCASGLRVLVLTEEPRSIWAERIRRHDAPDGLTVAFALGFPAQAVTERAFDGIEDVIVIDTWRSLLGVVDENDAAQVARAVNPLVGGARDADKTLILAHHARKGGGSFGEGVAGSHAIVATVDAVIELVRDPSGASRRSVRTLSRLDQLADLTYEQSEDGVLRLLGEQAAVTLLATEARVRDVLDEEWRTTTVVHDSLSEPRPSREQVRKALTELARQLDAERDPPLAAGDAPGRTLRWRRATSSHLGDLPLEEVGADATSHGAASSVAGERRRLQVPPRATSYNGPSLTGGGSGGAEPLDDDPMLRAALEVFGRPEGLDEVPLS